MQAGSQDDGVDVGGQHTRVVQVSHGQLRGDAGVVPTDRGHEQVEDGHDHQGDPGTASELGGQDDEQDQSGASHSDGVDHA